MEHRKKGRKLNRTASHRKALLSNLSISLIKNKRIKTTEAKAKELRIYFEPFITKAKQAYSFKDTAPEKDIHLRRVAKKYINDKEAIKILFDEIGPKVGDRRGGYTRVLKTGHRVGDGARLALIELVDYSFIKEKESTSSGKKGKKIKEKAKVEEETTKETDSITEEIIADEESTEKKGIVEKSEKKKTKTVKKTSKVKDKQEKAKKVKPTEDKKKKEVDKDKKTKVTPKVKKADDTKLKKSKSEKTTPVKKTKK
ncbi:MAG: 50S ribosomal protein L17 [Ignavibacteria bacterium]|nr:50S ribosomal protein L17 [Ignavibacteria bacterium]